MKQACRVVAIGEVLWDLFDDSRTLGGAPLNFAAHGVHLGSEVRLISAVGEDALGSAALEAIRKTKIDARYVQPTPAFPTGAARVQLGPDGQPSFRIERPAAYDAVVVGPAECNEIAAWAPDWLYFGTLFAYSERARIALRALSSALPGTRKFYDVNLRPGCYSPELVLELLRLANVVKLNETEMSAVAAMAYLPESGLEDFCAAGARQFGWGSVAITLGEHGCAVWRPGEYAELPAYQIRVVDTVGSGDAFAAAMLHGLHYDWPARAIADYANQLGALVASRPGGMPDWNMGQLRAPDFPISAEAGPPDALPPPGAKHARSNK